MAIALPPLPVTTNSINGNGTVSGTSQNDQISVGNGTNTILGLEGDDIIYGGSGNDSIRGGPGNDYIYGAGGNNVMFGGDGNDVIYGGDGDDLLIGGKGDDFLFGGGGVNTAVFNELTGQTKISNSNGTETVTGPDGTDTLQQISTLRFLDGTTSTDTGSTVAKAYRLYQAAFNRAPDAQGFSYFVDQLDAGLSPAALAQVYLESPEFAQRYGGTASQLSNQQYISQLYQNVLGRPATNDQTGAAFWQNALDSGAASKADVLVDFAESTENVNHTAAALTNGLFVPSRSAIEVEAAYKAVFNRAADTSGLQFWTGQIQYNGASIQTLANSLLASPEFQNSMAAGAGVSSTNAAFAQAVVTNALGANDANGTAFWTAQLNAGAVTRADVVSAYANAREVQFAVAGNIQNGLTITNVN